MEPFVKAFTSSEFIAVFQRLTEARPDLQVLGYILGPDRVLEYAHSIGLVDAELRAVAPPVPPESLRSIVAAREEAIFLWTGLVDAGMFLALFERHGALRDGAALFDFGCGCGRLTRYLGVASRYRTHASDINAQLVDWCREHLKTVDTRLNGERPPLPFGSDEIDCCYSLSIFTHLPENLVKAWIIDIARIVKPGGLFAFTTHGATALSIIKASPAHHAMFRVTAEETAELERQVSREGFVYLRYAPDVIGMANAGDDYGNCFVTPDHVRQNWIGTDWQFVECLPGGLRGWQDIIVLRRL